MSTGRTAEKHGACWKMSRPDSWWWDTGTVPRIVKKRNSVPEYTRFKSAGRRNGVRNCVPNSKLRPLLMSNSPTQRTILRMVCTKFCGHKLEYHMIYMRQLCASLIKLNATGETMEQLFTLKHWICWTPERCPNFTTVAAFPCQIVPPSEQFWDWCAPLLCSLDKTKFDFQKTEIVSHN